MRLTLFFRIILILWRILWTFLPSNGSWIQGSTKNPGSMWTMSGLCSTMRGYIIVRHPGCINFAVNSQRSLSKKSTLLCSLLDIAVDERYSISGKEIFWLIQPRWCYTKILTINMCLGALGVYCSLRNSCLVDVISWSKWEVLTGRSLSVFFGHCICL